MYRRRRVNIQLFCIQPWIYISNSFVSEVGGQTEPSGSHKACLLPSSDASPLTTSGCGHILLSIPKLKRATVRAACHIQFVMISCIWELKYQSFFLASHLISLKMQRTRVLNLEMLTLSLSCHSLSLFCHRRGILSFPPPLS